MRTSPTHDVQAAAGHLAAAAHHLAAAGDRAAYWALLAHVERLVGVPESAQDFAELAAGYAAGVLTFPEACRGTQAAPVGG